MSRKKQARGGAWCGIGMERPKTPANLGTLWRSAVCLGADFIFTIGHRYHPMASDTVKAPTHVPCFEFADLDDFAAHRPFQAPLVGVELTDDARPLETFEHPRQAVYLLGPEDGSLSSAARALCQYVVAFDSRYCLNVAAAGTVVLYDRHMKQSWRRRKMLEVDSLSPQEALRCALAAVWAGADRIDAEAVSDQLADLGFVVVERLEVAPHALRNRELPFASTASLPKRAAP